jgi:hypothetical protein
MIRSVVAVVAGFVAFVVLTTLVWLAFGLGPGDVPSESLLLLSLAFEAVFSVLGGYLTATIAGARGARLAAVLAAVMGLYGLVGLFVGCDAYPMWVHLSTMLVLAPCCYLGGRLRQWMIRPRLEAGVTT